MIYLIILSIVLFIAFCISLIILINVSHRAKDLMKLQGKYNDLEEALKTQLITDQGKAREAFASQQSEFAKALLFQQEETNKKIDEIKNSLRYYEDLQSAVVAEHLGREQVAMQRGFHKIELDEVELSDIGKLKPVARQISKPIILYKLIYEIYYKPKLDVMFKRVLGSVEAEGGIYKITNVNNEKVYIGRATNFLNRWRQHAKCGTGADTGAQINTRLYEAMQQEGIENFTFEVIDICSPEDQAAREKYWVDYYRSTEYGYNIKGGG